MTENKMGVAPVNQLLVSMSVPMMISMLVQALYNIVDSAFVARLNENALTAVSLAFPWQNFMIAVGVGTGIGVNAVLSRALGQKNPKLASSIADHGLFLALTSTIVFMITGTAITRPFFEMQTNVSQIIDYGTSYMYIVSLCSIGLFVTTMTEKLLSSTGKTSLTMINQLTGAIINIILDPIFIFGFGPIPSFGVAGAAIATVIGQIMAACAGLYLNFAHNKEIAISFRGFKPQAAIIRHIYGIGLPSIIMQSISSLLVFFLNQILIAFSTTATAVLGIYFKLQSFVFMPIFGLNNGLVPIVAYNYGARNKERIMKAFKLGVLYAVGIMAAGCLVFHLFPGFLLGLFDADENMLAIGIPALRIISLCFIFAGFGIICSSFFQALGHGFLSMAISIVRQIAALLPLAWLFSRTGELVNIWWAFPLAEGISVILSCICLVWIVRHQIEPLGQQ